MNYKWRLLEYVEAKWNSLRLINQSVAFLANGSK